MAIANAIGVGFVSKRAVVAVLGKTWASFATGGSNPKTWAEIQALGTTWGQLV